MFNFKGRKGSVNSQKLINALKEEEIKYSTKITLDHLKYALMLATEIVTEATSTNHANFKTLLEAIDFRNAFALRSSTKVSLLVRGQK